MLMSYVRCLPDPVILPKKTAHRCTVFFLLTIPSRRQAAWSAYDHRSSAGVSIGTGCSEITG